MRVFCVGTSQLVVTDPLAPTFWELKAAVINLGLKGFSFFFCEGTRCFDFCTVNDLASSECSVLNANHLLAFLSADGGLRRDATGGPGGCEWRHRAPVLEGVCTGSSRPMSQRLGLALDVFFSCG